MQPAALRARPSPLHRTGHADLPHPPPGQDLTPFGLLAFADVDEHVDRTGHSSGRIEQWRRMGDEWNPHTVGPLGYCFHATNKSLLLQRHCHWALIARQRRTVRPVELPGTAELAIAE